MAERLQRMKKEGKEHGKYKAEQEHPHRAGEPPVPRHMEAAEELPGCRLEPGTGRPAGTEHL